MVLFVLFAFIYIYQIQGYVLAEAQYVFSDGVTTYSRLWGAIIITALLAALQVVVSRFARLTGRWYALTYAPSFVALTMLTSLYRPTIEHFSFGRWLWVLPVFIVVYLLVIRVMRRWLTDYIERGDYSAGRYLWPNFLIMLLMMLACGANAPANDVYLYEMKAEHYLLHDDYEAAARVGQKSLQTSPRLNQMRMYALAQQGLLGEHLFDYPQPYADRSLIILDDTVTHYARFTSKNIQEALGAWANTSVTSADQYLELLRKNPSTASNPLLHQYLLCGKLLQGDVRSFCTMLRHYHNTSTPQAVNDLPRAYREALLLQARNISRDSLNAFADTATLARYEAYCQLRDSEPDSLHRANRLHRQYGNTLWWYLDYMID